MQTLFLPVPGSVRGGRPGPLLPRPRAPARRSVGGLRVGVGRSRLLPPPRRIPGIESETHFFRSGLKLA